MRICELFYSIEGEGLWTGLPSSVIRLAGCNLKCDYCDTKFSSWWDNDTEIINIQQAITRIEAFPVHRLSITGGEPLFRSAEELEEVMQLIKYFTMNHDYLVKIETNATLYNDRLGVYPIFWSLSPKLKGMGKVSHVNYEVIGKYLDRNYVNEKVQLKFVVGARNANNTMEEDLTEIKNLIKAFPTTQTCQVPIILQPEGLTENLSEYAVRLADLAERISFDNNIDADFWKDINVRVLPQVHRIMWNNRRQV